MSIRKVVIGLAILIIVASVIVLLINPSSPEAENSDFVVFGKPLALGMIFIAIVFLSIMAYNQYSDKKAEVDRAKMAEQMAAEQKQKAMEAERLKALPKLINCPACNKEVSREALACPSCGHPISQVGQKPQVPPTPETTGRSWSPGVAAVLSLVIPGAGQMYKGHVGAGLLWLLFVVAGYVCFIFPGVILHIVCILNAATGGK
jgi:cbb3-type cytochrome oxidase subunit 3